LLILHYHNFYLILESNHLKKLIFIFLFLTSLKVELVAQQFNAVGSATSQSCSCYQLTPNIGWQGGAVWNNNALNLAVSFDFNFQVYLGCNDGGADGIAFVLQNTNTGSSGNGGGLGYMGFPNQSVAIEIDTYENSTYGDPWFDHIGLESQGNINHNLVAPVQASASFSNIEDCAWHDFRVVWNATTQNMTVYFDGVQRLTYTFPGGIINSIFGGSTSNIYWGFTGATGQLFNLQQFCIDIDAAFTTGNNFNVCGTTNIQFTNNSQSGLNSIVNYVWDFGDGTYSNMASPQHTYSQPGTYTVELIITDQSLCTSTQIQTVNVFEQPVANAVVTNACSGGNTGVIDLTVSMGTGPYNVTWNPQPANISQNGNNFTASSLAVGSYAITVTDANGCSVQLTETVSAPANPVDLQLSSVNGVLCAGGNNGSLSLNAVNGTAPYTFSLLTNSNSTGSFNNLSGGSFMAFVTDQSGCSDSLNVVVPDLNTPLLINTLNLQNVFCFGGNDGAFSIQASGGVGPYQYQVNGAAASATTNYNNLVAGNYVVLVTDALGCTHDTIILIQEPNNGITISTVQIINPLCTGNSTGSIEVNATGGNGAPYQFVWNTVPSLNGALIQNLPAGNYTVTVSDNNNCTALATFTLIDPVFQIQAINDFSICEGVDTTLQISINGGSGSISVNWLNTLNGQQNQGNPFQYVPLSDAGFQVTAIDQNGCISNQIQFNTTVLPAPDFIFSADILSGCAPVCNLFTGQSNTPGVLVFWNFGDGTTASGFTADHCFLQAGSYAVMGMAIATNGCKKTLVYPDYIDVYSNPLALFSTNKEEYTTADAAVSFDAEAGPDFNYLWKLENGDVLSQEEKFVYDFLEDGTYCVQLTVTNTYGCMDTTQRCIKINPESSFYIPSAFTPNGDGKDDLFMPIGKEIAGMQLSIYNRWGGLIYSRNENSLVHWDGSNFPQDAYVYRIFVVDKAGYKKEYIGTVTLLR
jgi:gliding motility-associated-like protein